MFKRHKKTFDINSTRAKIAINNAYGSGKSALDTALESRDDYRKMYEEMCQSFSDAMTKRNRVIKFVLEQLEIRENYKGLPVEAFENDVIEFLQRKEESEKRNVRMARLVPRKATTESAETWT